MKEFQSYKSGDYSDEINHDRKGAEIVKSDIFDLSVSFISDLNCNK